MAEVEARTRIKVCRTDLSKRGIFQREEKQHQQKGEETNGEIVHFYRSAMDENCVAMASALFQDLPANGSVAVEAKFLVDHCAFVNTHNHMKSSKSWKSVSPWDSGVEYMIQHPESDIIVSDTNRGQKTSVFREHVLMTVHGATASRSIVFVINKVRRDQMNYQSRSYHDSVYKWVKIKSEKVFVYESPRSSWNFRLAVVWEGKTKACAETAEKQYSVIVSMGSPHKATADTRYTTASFFEKIMDVLFLKPTSLRHIMLKFFDA